MRMSRYLIGVLLGCLYAALASWVVRSQGEAYRAALRSGRPAVPRPRPGPTSPAPLGSTATGPGSADAGPALTPAPPAASLDPAEPRVSPPGDPKAAERAIPHQPASRREARPRGGEQ